MPLRPPALSDSFAYHAFNIQRAEDLPIEYIEKKPKHWEAMVVRYALRFLLHICLIGLFETVFFFYFVSVQENNGLLQDVDDVLGQVSNGCASLTQSERTLISDVVQLAVNGSQLNELALANSALRTRYNHSLLVQAWMYEVGMTGLFLACALYSYIRKIRVRWNRILLENMVLILCLGLYEYIFFSTIVLQFMPITVYELEAKALQTIETNC